MSPRSFLQRAMGALALALIASSHLSVSPSAEAAPVSAQIVEPSSDSASWGFQPPVLTVAVNDTVTWSNTGTQAHTVTADTNAFDSGLIASNGSWPYSASVAGTFTYHCELHPWMKGTLVVQAAGAAAAPAAPTIRAAAPTVAAVAATVLPTARPAATAAPTARPASTTTVSASGTAPRAGGFPTELAVPLLVGGGAALLGGLYILRRGRTAPPNE